MVSVGQARAMLAAVGVALVAGCGEDGAAAERGAQIAFTANQGGGVSVVVVAADGRDRMRVEQGASSPAWSPDGERLAFVRVRGDDSDIAVMDADGSAPRSVTSGAGRDRDPALSPDGQTAVATGGSLAHGPMTAIPCGRPAAVRSCSPATAPTGSVTTASSMRWARAETASRGSPTPPRGASSPHGGPAAQDAPPASATGWRAVPDARWSTSTCGPLAASPRTRCSGSGAATADCCCRTPSAPARKSRPRRAFRETAVRLHAGTQQALRRALAALRPLDGAPGGRLAPPAHRCE
jgi:hypothetical protein